MSLIIEPKEPKKTLKSVVHMKEPQDFGLWRWCFSIPITKKFATDEETCGRMDLRFEEEAKVDVAYSHLKNGSYIWIYTNRYPGDRFLNKVDICAFHFLIYFTSFYITKTD